MPRSLMTLLALLLAALPAMAEGDRKIRSRYPVQGIDSLHLEIPVAEVRLEGFDGDEVEVEIFLECRRERRGDCLDLLNELRLTERRHGAILALELEGYPRWGKGRIEVEARVRMPRRLGLDLELSVGEVDVEQLEGDLHLEIGVGEANLWLRRQAVRSVRLDAGVGEVELHGAGGLEARRSLFVGSEVSWLEGEGESRVRVDVGVGEVSAWLD